jgi:FMN-dependent oxidoreductase (nitrilotriacetate monooxygenase family)
MPKSAQMHLAVIVNGVGAHIGGWRLPEAEVGPTDIRLLTRIVQTAERGKFDMAFIADAVTASASAGPSVIVRLEPLTTLSALAMQTSRIGLAATVSTTYSEPYNVARMLGSLDFISEGRIGWNVVTTSDANAAQNFGLVEHAPKEERYARAEEFLTIVKGLWDSWEDGAVIQDKASGRFTDLSKRHVLDHKGAFYSVRGPLNMSRPPQGHPVIIQAGASKSGLPFAARAGEVVFTVQDDIETTKAFRASLRELAVEAGRDPDHLKVIPGVAPLIADSEEAGRELLERLSSYMDADSAWAQLSNRLDIDLTDLPPEGPVPKIPFEQMRGHAKTLTAVAEKYGFNLRQLRNYCAVAAGHHVVIGPPKMIADDLQAWFESGACDGFMILPAWHHEQLNRFVDEVVPILQARGLFRREYKGRTLRDHLGLARPPHPAARA